MVHDIYLEYTVLCCTLKANAKHLPRSAGLLTRKSTQKDSDTDSSSAAMRLLFDKAERGGKDVLQLSHLLTSSNEASGSEPSEPYGRYHAISSLLIRQAMDSYVPMWVKVCVVVFRHSFWGCVVIIRFENCVCGCLAELAWCVGRYSELRSVTV